MGLLHHLLQDNNYQQSIQNSILNTGNVYI